MRLIVARCSVEYSGRLSARLPEALRLVILKADGSVLVHADAGGYKPLNWMTPPTVVEEDGGRIVVVGGEELEPGGTTIGEVEMFNPRTGRWRALPDMRTPRHGLGGAALGNRVFAVEGGPQPGLAFSNAIEFLDVPPR